MKKLKSLNLSSELTEEVPEDNWLPNFGRVFNAGPRRMTAQEFRGEQHTTSSTTKKNTETPRSEDDDGEFLEEHVESDSKVPAEPKVIYGPLI